MRLPAEASDPFLAAGRLAELLPGWSGWAEDQLLDNLSQQMCHGPGPDPVVTGFDRAEVAGVPFACERIQKSTQAKICTVMVRVQQGGFAVGQVRLFFRWDPPWSTPATSKQHELEVADVQWYGKSGVNPRLFGAPQVFRHFVKDAYLNICLVEEIIPCQICLVPHTQRQNAWQVLFLGRPA